MIAIDWGTSNFRAFRIRAGAITGRVATGTGLLAVPTLGFPAALHAAIGPWLQDGERHVVMAGMVGSRQGWVEAPYLPCPADMLDLAVAAIRVPFDAADVRLIPGLATTDPGGVPEVMRGEEVQVAGALERIGPLATVCLPGSHSKWVSVVAGRIAAFSTHLTGEAFAALRDHTILARSMTDAPHHEGAFIRGVDRSGDAGGLLHHLFGVRALGLFDRLADTEAASFLSGLLIGHEVRAASSVNLIYLVGGKALCARYASAIERLGSQPVILDEDAAAIGLWRLSEHIEWT